MAHNFSHSDISKTQASGGKGPKALIDQFLDAIWMERGLSENTLGAYRADLLALRQRLDGRDVEMVGASRCRPIALPTRLREPDR